MWIFTTQGFYSADQHREEPGKVIVRARSREDIEALRAQIPTLEPFEDASADYRYRAIISKEEWVAVLALFASEIDYPNFKSAVGERQGDERALLYGRLWDELLSLQREERTF